MFERTPLVMGCAAVSVILSADSARAQREATKPWVGERGIVESVADITARDRARARDVSSHAPAVPDTGHAALVQHPGSAFVSSWPPNGALPLGPNSLTGGEQPPAAAPQGVGTSFLVDVAGFIVPCDPSVAVSPTQIMAVTNEVIKVFDKDGTVGGLNVSIATFFASVGVRPDRPHVRYDTLSGRWFVATLDFVDSSTPNKFMLAVSDGSVVTSSSNFTFYSFQQDLVAPAGDTGLTAYNDKFAVDANALYFGAAVASSTTYFGTSAWVVRKSSVLSGGPLVATAFRGLAGGSGMPGIEAPMGVDNDDPLATEGYIIGVSQNTLGLLLLRRVSDPGGTPTISAEIPLTVPATAEPNPQPHMSGGGGTSSFSSFALLGDRLFSAMIHRNRLTGIRSLWTAHHIEVNTSGVADPSGGRNGARWYQIDDLSTTPTLTQSGTHFDPVAGNARGYYFPSVAASGQGHMALASSASSAGTFIGIAAAGRLASDPLGTTQAAIIAQPGLSYWNNGAHWGSYSNIAIDPIDDQTMWAIGSYTHSPNGPAARVVQLRAPPPATPLSASPDHVVEGMSSVLVVITGSSPAGAGFYDTEPGLNRLSASFGGGISVNSVSWDSPTQITLDLAIAPGTATGRSGALTVTNPDGQSRSSIEGILTIDSSTCIDFVAQPADDDACVGNAAMFSVIVAGASAPTYQWRKDGVDIGGANASSYTISVVALADEAEYDVVVTDPCGVATSASATLTIQEPCVTGIAFCFGDGSLPTPCPCVPPNFIPNPSGAPDGGCANSFDPGGARLTATGNPALNDVLFSVSIGGNSAAFGLMLKGNAADPAGVASGDGVRCVDGQLIRFGGHNASTNGAAVGWWTYPNSVQTNSVATATAQPPGETAFYQLYYRNLVPGFCNPATTNMSNGYQIEWP